MTKMRFLSPSGHSNEPQMLKSAYLFWRHLDGSRI